MKQYPRMLYRTPGPEMVDGVACELMTVADEAAHVAAEMDGWRVSLDLLAEDAARPPREALEQQAAELGLKFDGRTGDKKLAALIAEKLAA